MDDLVGNVGEWLSINTPDLTTEWGTGVHVGVGQVIGNGVNIEVTAGQVGVAGAETVRELVPQG